MRVDKFLKVSRILKRRMVSKELAAHQRIQINGRPAKAAHEVNVGDEVTVVYGNRSMTIRVLAVPSYSKKEEASQLYEILDEHKEETLKNEDDPL